MWNVKQRKSVMTNLATSLSMLSNVFDSADAYNNNNNNMGVGGSIRDVLYGIVLVVLADNEGNL
jgi:hypothetical protein